MPGSIKIDDGSGNYTILTNAGSLGSDKTLTIPNETGTLNLQSGSVLQVVQGTLTSEASTTSSTYADTGLSVSITPSSTSSKILISFAHHTHYSRSFDYGGGIIKLLRDTTNIDEFRSWMQVGTGGLVAVGRTLTSQILDSPSTTSAITYKTQYKVHYAANSETFKVAYESATYNTIDTITAIEIGG